MLIIGGDSKIARDLASKIVCHATTRRKESVDETRPFLDLALSAIEVPDYGNTACLCAAVTNVAACQADPSGTAFINLTQTVRVAEMLRQRGYRVLFLSTNRVFDGSTPYTLAESGYCPTTEYGQQKWEAERELLERGCCVLRLSKVVSAQEPLFTGWIEALTTGQEVTAFDDMWLSPVPIDKVSWAIIRILQDKTAKGIYQLSGPADISYAEVAHMLADSIGADHGLVKHTQYVGDVPLHTTLDSRRVSKEFGIVAPEPRAVFDQFA